MTNSLEWIKSTLGTFFSLLGEIDIISLGISVLVCSFPPKYFHTCLSLFLLLFFIFWKRKMLVNFAPGIAVCKKWNFQNLWLVSVEMKASAEYLCSGTCNTDWKTPDGFWIAWNLCFNTLALSVFFRTWCNMGKKNISIGTRSWLVATYGGSGPHTADGA